VASVVAKHYLQVTDQRFAVAAMGKAAHFAAQSATATPRTVIARTKKTSGNYVRRFRGMASSGGGTRTPDTRIVILQASFVN
jgi:hypothetical protein